MAFAAVDARRRVGTRARRARRARRAQGTLDGDGDARVARVPVPGCRITSRSLRIPSRVRIPSAWLVVRVPESIGFRSPHPFFLPCTREYPFLLRRRRREQRVGRGARGGFRFFRRDVARLLRLFGRLLGNRRARLARGTLALDPHFAHDLLGLASRRGLALHRPRALRLSPRRLCDRTSDVRVADAEDVAHAEGIGRRGTKVRADGEARPARQQKRQRRAEVPPFPRRLASHRVDARATSMGEWDDRMRTSVDTPRNSSCFRFEKFCTLRCNPY